MKVVGAVVHLPDMRGVTISPFGYGNVKIGADVYTYSRLAGGSFTCPGATVECESICYAKRIDGPVYELYHQNSRADGVPPLPDDCRLLRIHVSGDFDAETYIRNWTARLQERPDVRAWAYTRSWRVPGLISALWGLWELPNMQLFASMDASTVEAPPLGWRCAWIADDPREEVATSYDCPEQTGRKADCQSCRYCFDGWRNDVTFSKH